MILVIDNHDSFTYNLVQYLGEVGARVEVACNDAISLAQIEGRAPQAIVLSPGPGTVADAGITLEVVHHFAGRIPLLGVCLGHQAIAHAFGASVVRAARLMHGRTSEVLHDGRGLFQGLPNPLCAMRYHSWVVDAGSLPAELEVSAWTREGEVMALRHSRLPIASVQFHPESFLSEHGHSLLRNFLAVLPPSAAAAHARRSA